MRKSIILLLCASFGLTAAAQTGNEWDWVAECQRLHSDGKHTTVLSLLNSMDIKSLDDRTRQEVELMRVISTYECNPAEGCTQIEKYLTDYPETSKRDLLNCYMAQSYYYGGKYELACRWFEKCNLKQLTPLQHDRALFYRALSLACIGKEGDAENLFRNLSLTSDEYAVDAKFHMAVIKYEHNELEDALKGFKEIENEEKYKLDIPYYLGAICLKQGEVEQAKTIAETFIDEHTNEAQCNRMYQILGAAEFMTGNYEAATNSLTAYIDNTASPQHIAFYQLGVSLYNQGENSKAEEYLTKCNSDDDAIGQSALLYTGLINLKEGKTNSARMALEQAAQMKHDNKVREEALYNYALCILPPELSPFAESVKAFEQFMNEFPNSPHAEKVAEYLLVAYTQTRRYDVALQSINKIKRPTEKMLKAKQNILHHMGIQEFINGNMDGAINYFDQSIELTSRFNRTFDKETLGATFFWRGEALFRNNEYAKARSSYEKANEVDRGNNPNAMYGIGYTYFKEKSYDEALNAFKKFVEQAPKSENNLLADTYSRIGDCYFYKRKFDSAKEYYIKGNTDYALYRLAKTAGLTNSNNESIKALNKLIENYPNSVYTEQALYDLGRSHIKQEQYDQAIGIYNKLIKDFPKSPTARRAATEMAMIYNAMGNREKSIAAYKKIIADYPHSEEAQVAFQDLKSMYVDMGKVEDFAKYTRSVNFALNSSEIDTLAYMAAEKMYSRGDIKEAKKAFDKYLQDTPEGVFKVHCYYYKGLISYRQKKSDDALENFKVVLEYPDSKFYEEAQMVSAEIYYGKKMYNEASALYKVIAQDSKSEERRRLAVTNIMQAAVVQNKHKEVITYATMLCENATILPEVERNARYNKAKAHLALKEKGKALGEFKKLAEDTRSKEGAEAKYIVAQLMFNDRNYKLCENEIRSFIEMSTPHTYWMARSFVLLADLYIAQDKILEARQYLLSLQNNYDEDDDIDEMIAQRLEMLDNINE